MRQEANSMRAGRAKAMTSISVSEGTANYFSQLYDPGTIPDAVWSWGIEQLYNQSMHWSPAHVHRYCLEMQIQLTSKMQDGIQLASVVSKTKRYPYGTFKQQLNGLTRKIFVHNKKLKEIGEQVEDIMQDMQSALEEQSTVILTYGKMSVDFDEFREYHKVLASARILQDVDWLNSDLTTHPGIL